jgi:hypothetical protein
VEVLRTNIGGWTYLFPLGSVARVFEASAPEGAAVRWHEAEFVVNDLAASWGDDPPSEQGYYVELLGAEPPTAVRVTSLEGVQRMPDTAGIPLQPWWFVPGGGFFSRAFPEGGKLLLLIDPSALLNPPKGEN